MNESNIISALNSYDGTQPSLEKTVSVLSAEIGPDWMNLVFQQLGDLPVELKEKLNHVFNYYASLMAWQEAQSYLAQKEPLDADLMEERLPVLKHWLDFFGQPGRDLYQQLEDFYHQQSSDVPLPPDDDGSARQEDVLVEKDSDLSDEDKATDEMEVSEDFQQPQSGMEDIQPVAEDIQTEAEQVQPVEDLEDAVGTTSVEMPDEEPETEKTDEEVTSQTVSDDTPEGFIIRKVQREIALLDDLHAWLAARCVELDNIEIFAYPYYGMLVDLMRQVVKDIQAVLSLKNQDIVMQYYPNGLADLVHKKQAIEADIQVAVENCESDTTALIDKNMDMEKVKKALGDLDESREKEYLGPAPDGFELLDNGQPIDEKAVKEQYEQLEEDAQKKTQKQDISVTNEKKTSQNSQNGVQRRLSFSLKPKKG